MCGEMLHKLFKFLAISALSCVIPVCNGRQFDLFPDLPVGIVDSKNIVCREQTKMYLDNLKNMSLWAYEMNDATAKSVTGILRGSIFQFGQFHECLEAKAPFRTQYCLATVIANVMPPDPPRDPRSLYYNRDEMVLRKVYDKKDPSQQPENVVLLGWCVPASCTPNDLQTHLNTYLQNVDFPLKQENVTYFSQIDESSCQKSDENLYFDHVDISFCLVIGIIVVLICSSSMFDLLWCKEKEKLTGISPVRKLFTSFAIQNNISNLCRSDENSPALQILYGMRVVCIFMIILGHRFGTHLSVGVMNFNTVEEAYRSLTGTFFFHGDLFVDSFFILSGILVTYCLLVQYDKKFINPGFIVFMRYVRLTPLYAFVIFYYATLFAYSGSGPMWKTVIYPEVQDCRQNWWTNILYISNYINADHMCMVHSWYLPCDFHYFIVAVLLCIVIYKKKTIGLMLLGLMTFLSVLVPFVIGYVYARPAVLYFYPEFLRSPKTYNDFLIFYSKSHTRATPYFIGMIGGYLYYRMKGSDKCLKKGYSYTIFISSLILMISSILTGLIFYDPFHEYNALESASYAAIHRAVWAIGSMGVLYVASYGHAKFVYNFLSWKAWVPLSKLVYGVYLVHMQFQMRAMARKAGNEYISYFDIISGGFSDILLAFGTAFILYLTVESPFRNIFSILLLPPKQQNKTNEKKENISETTCDSHL